MKIIASILVFFTTALLYSQSDNRFRIVENNKIGYINSIGEIVIKPIYANGGNFSDGVAAVRENGLYGFIDINGNYIIEPKYDYATQFNEGYALAYKKGEEQIINKKGESVPDEISKNLQENDQIDIPYKQSVFDSALPDLVNDKWGIVDTLGNYLVPPKFEKIDYFDTNGFVNGLLLIQIKGKPTYINKKGDIIWQQPKPGKDISIKPLNIDFMMRGYYYAYSKTKGNNGWAESDNLPKKIASKKFPKKQLSLVIDPNEKAVFAEEFYGCKVYLANTSGKKVTINASDSRLDIVLQAQDSEGNWKDIEYTPRSWCGNSYHYVDLKSGEYWDFTMPLYDGADKTKIRAAFTYYKDKEEKIIYSNIIEGSINPAQFFNKPDFQMELWTPITNNRIIQKSNNLTV